MDGMSRICTPAAGGTFQETQEMRMCLINMKEEGGTQKYLRKSYYHRIECTATTFLAAFMWRKPLNSAALATTTHRKPRRVSNGTSTQVTAQMTNKCKIKMVQREIYNVWDLPLGGGQKKERENTVTIKVIFVNCLIDLYGDLPPWTVN